MLTKVLLPIVLISRVFATPVSTSTPSFNGYGIQSLNGFDNFYGSNDFSGSLVEQIVQEQVVVCQPVSIEIIQQKLVVLQEVAKRIITEQICEVETQTVVLEQFSSGISSFSGSLMRNSDRQIGYDSNIASHLGQIVNSDGSLSNYDLGFSGSQVGQNTIVPTGNNWNSATSPASVSQIRGAAKQAVKASSGKSSSGKSSSGKSKTSSASSSTTSASAKASTSAVSTASASTASASTTSASTTSAAVTSTASASSASASPTTSA